MFRTSAVILLGWLAVSVALGALGVYHAESTEIPTIQYSILLPIVIGALLIWRSETAKSVISLPCRNHGLSACNSIARSA